MTQQLSEIESVILNCVDRHHIEKNIETLSEIGRDPDNEGGVTKLAFTLEETRAHDYIRKQGQKIGLQEQIDDIGNLFLIYNPNSENDEYILTGSHLDTVNPGGKYDGTAGVVASLEAIKALKAANINQKKKIKLVVWRGEESTRFSKPYLGSGAAFGEHDPSLLYKKDKEGITLEQAITNRKFNVSSIKSKTPTIDRDNIAAYIELHIEQASILEKKKKDIGIVTSIRGNRRFKVQIYGRYDHSGGTPMDMRLDANVVMVEFLSGVNDLVNKYQKEGLDFVITYPVIHTDGNRDSINKISGYIESGFDIRSKDSHVLDRICLDINNILNDISKKRNVTSKVTELTKSTPLSYLDSDIQTIIKKKSDSLGIRNLKLPSGAGHDAAVVGKNKNRKGIYIPTAMIFVPSFNDGVSHDPGEFTPIEYIIKGTKVLALTLYELIK